MACGNLFEFFDKFTTYLGRDIHVRASHQAIMLNLIQSGVYERGIGLTKTTYTIGRQEPSSDEESWVAIPLVSGENKGACESTYNDANFGYNSDTYSPEQFALQGPELCKDDLYYQHASNEFLEKYLTAISIRARRSWENRLLKLYIDFSLKGVARSNFSLGNSDSVLSTTALSIATSALTQEMLDSTALELIYSGATNPDSQGWITLGDEGPQFPLLIGLEMSNQLAANNADLRNDIRWADAGKGAENKGALLLKAVGANRVIKNFRHVPAIFPPRYTYNGTNYVRVSAFEDTAGTKGTISTVRAAWKAAPYEAAVVLNPNVFVSEKIPPINMAAGLTWDPTNHMGEWQWVTGRNKWNHECVDPLMKYGRHFSEFKHAPRPVFPEYGVTILFKRCPLSSFSTIYCT